MDSLAVGLEGECVAVQESPTWCRSRNEGDGGRGYVGRVGWRGMWDYVSVDGGVCREVGWRGM